MNEDLKKFAKQAGFPSWWLNPSEPERQNGEAMKMLEAFAKLVIEAERDRLAAQFEYDSPHFGLGGDDDISRIAAYIRAGGR